MGQQNTSRHRKAVQPASSTRTKAHRSSATLQAAPKRRRTDPNAPSYIVGGAVIALIGLGFAVGLAMTAVGPSAGERSLALLIAPWIVFAGGLGLTVFGFLHMGGAERSSGGKQA